MDNTPHPLFIEFEISSYCNRRCNWCPNSTNFRGESQRYVDQDLYTGFLTELASHNYVGWLAFHNYNEPLAADNLFWCVESVKRISPQTQAIIYSNGDYLNRRLMADLGSAGIKQLRVTLYPPRARLDYNLQSARMLIWRFLRRMDLVEFHERLGQTHRGLEIEIVVDSVRLTVTAADPLRYTNRGASLYDLKTSRGFSRIEPCHVPSRAAAIDVDGNLKLCCQFQDVTTPDSADYMIGNVANGNFWALWNGPRMMRYREMLARADFSALPKCGECDKLP